jgi:hypothetical protein
MTEYLSSNLKLLVLILLIQIIGIKYACSILINFFQGFFNVSSDFIFSNQVIG